METSMNIMAKLLMVITLFLAGQYAYADETLNEAFVEAAADNNIQLVSELLNKGAEIDFRIKRLDYKRSGEPAFKQLKDYPRSPALGDTALIAALMAHRRPGERPNMLPMIQFLISRHADVNGLHGGWGRNALTIAARHWRPHPEVVKVLLAAGARVDATFLFNFTALHTLLDVRGTWRFDEPDFVIRRLAVAEQLCRAGTNLMAREYSGLTPLHMVAQIGDPHLAALLVFHGAHLGGADLAAEELGRDGPPKWASLNTTPVGLALLEQHRREFEPDNPPARRADMQRTIELLRNPARARQFGEALVAGLRAAESLNYSAQAMELVAALMASLGAEPVPGDSSKAKETLHGDLQLKKLEALVDAERAKQCKASTTETKSPATTVIAPASSPSSCSSPDAGAGVARSEPSSSSSS